MIPASIAALNTRLLRAAWPSNLFLAAPRSTVWHAAGGSALITRGTDRLCSPVFARAMAGTHACSPVLLERAP